MNELVSIIWTTHHEPIDMIEWSLDSLNNQTYQNCEFVLINDSSVIPGAHEYLNYYVKTHPRFKYIQLIDNVGYSRAKNIGIIASNGKYSVIIDADMAMRPDFVECAVKEFESHEDCYLVEGSTLRLFPSGQVLSYPMADGIKYDMYPDKPAYFLNIGAFLTTREVLMNSGMFQELDISDVILFINMHMQYELKKNMKHYIVSYDPNKYEDWNKIDSQITIIEKTNTNRSSNASAEYWNTYRDLYSASIPYALDLLKNNHLL